METRCCVSKLEGLQLNMGFKFWAGVDSVGLSGGLWAAWDDKYCISLLHACCNFMVLSVVNERGVKWALCLLYGHPCLSERRRVWDLLGDFLKQLKLPVLIAGDFNQILSPEEKFSSNTRTDVGINWL